MIKIIFNNEVTMPYSPQHKEESRLRILESAAKSFLHKGYEQTGINDVMRDAGMTRGAFYAHFSSKSELYDKAMLYAAAHGRLASHKNSGQRGSEWLMTMLEGYLSLDHLVGEETPCPLAFLVTDIANREPQVRQTYTRIYRRMNSLIERYRDNPSNQQNEEVLALTALMVGGVALSRVVDDERLAERILTSCRQTAAELLDIQ
ncbi:MAG: hypothetical protein B6D78_06460 [gamma proteobacterium symbiont of Ctena orbiculata]|nr:MAG: hypothetical protein B6D78_06460 [gamma proteobacterium symbiont of Ctena orbiculata]